MPSWLSSSPRPSPPSLPNDRRRPPRSCASSPIVSLASHDRSCATACCQTRAVALSLSRLPAFPRFLPWVGPPIRKTLRRWVIVFPSRTLVRHRTLGSSIRTAWTSYQGSVGRPFRAASNDSVSPNEEGCIRDPKTPQPRCLCGSSQKWARPRPPDETPRSKRNRRQSVHSRGLRLWRFVGEAAGRFARTSRRKVR